ncbi:unnamed protein product [Absidia cylindrospora]
MNAIQIPTLVINPFSPALLIRFNSIIIGTVWLVMQYVFEKRKKAQFTFSGDDIPSGESALVISNHRSWTDFYMIHSMALRRSMLPNCKYFVKDSIKWFPFFGWGMWFAGFPFVRRNWMQDQNKINHTFAKFKELKTPAWIINYVEGSRFTPEKSQQCIYYSVKLFVGNVDILQRIMYCYQEQEGLLPVSTHSVNHISNIYMILL